MLAFIKANYQIGDSMEINCSEGVISGQIEYVDNQFIVLRQPNGKICGIAASDVNSFTAQCPVKLVPAHGVSATVPPAETENSNASGEPAASADSSTPADEGETTPTLRDVLDEKEIPSADQLTGIAPIVQPKVVGHIDLDSLQRMDPRRQRRTYFKSEDAASSTRNSESWRNSDAPRSPFVKAKGRIGFYNPTKRFGFIHDFNSDADLYFFNQQVADKALLDQLHRGTKVTYTIGKNSQGPMAMAVHLPRVAADLIDMADEHFHAQRYGFAKGLLEHVLEVCPDNQEALNLLEEVNHEMPKEQPVAEPRPSASSNTYAPSNTYAEAKKAYLDKDYAKAEELYLRAIEAEEKVESSVKDMLTLYVSCFKQAETDDDRKDILQKANDFLENHRHLLSANLTTKQFLALNYYLPTQNYDAFIRMVDEILSDAQVNNVISRKVFYLWQKGIALNKQGHSEEALAITEEGLKLAPHSRQLNNLREFILHPELAEEAAAEKQTSEEENVETKEQ